VWFFILCVGVAFGAGASFLRPKRGGATGGSGRWRRGEGEGCGSGTSGSGAWPGRAGCCGVAAAGRLPSSSELLESSDDDEAECSGIAQPSSGRSLATGGSVWLDLLLLLLMVAAAAAAAAVAAVQRAASRPAASRATAAGPQRG